VAVVTVVAVICRMVLIWLDNQARKSGKSDCLAEERSEGTAKFVTCPPIRMAVIVSPAIKTMPQYKSCLL
jgi:hypothetical protein